MKNTDRLETQKEEKFLDMIEGTIFKKSLQDIFHIFNMRIM